MASKLSLYNGAARVLGERRLADLTEDRELRHDLDAVWDSEFKKRVLEQGYWNFATRTLKMAYDPTVSPNFGYNYAFSKPSDWVRTVKISTGEYFSQALEDYEDKAGYWWLENKELYVQYISDDASYGGDLSLWPESFAEFAEHYLAYKIGATTSASRERTDDLYAVYRKARTEARSKDAMNQPSPKAPTGSWVNSRLDRGGRRDRGNTGSLIG